MLSHVRAKQPQVFSLGCLCHLAAVSALKTLPVSVDSLLIDVFSTSSTVPKDGRDFQKFLKILNPFEY